VVSVKAVCLLAVTGSALMQSYNNVAQLRQIHGAG
jgi:hypothetical protein